MKFFLWRLSLVALAGAFLGGCGAAMEMEKHAGEDTSAENEIVIQQPQLDDLADGKQGGEPAGKEQGEVEPDRAPVKVKRKIIYTASLSLVLEDLDGAQKELESLVKKFDGFIATSRIDGSTGYRRTGTWTIRVPVAKFEEFRAEVLSLGVPESNSLSSREVTEEYYDIRTRIETTKKHYDRLLKHLDQETKELKDILAVEQEIARVQREIEVMQGKLRRLEDLTSLTTVNVTLIEEKDYVPPQAPTFGGTIGNTFRNSADALLQFGKLLVLLVVAFTPWIPVILAGVLMLWLVRRQLRKARARSVEVPPSPEFPSTGTGKTS